MSEQKASGAELSFWQKLGYGVGDLFGGGSGVLISTYYFLFLIDVVRINPGLAGTVVLISKVYDSITDPFEGVLADRTRTKLGRRRPYLLAGIILVFLSFFLLFYPFNQANETARFAAVIVTYLFFSTVVSLVMLNYNALQSELTLDYDERTQLSSFRIFFSTIASLLSAVLPPEIVDSFPDVRVGYMVMAAAFGAFYALPFLFTVLATRERPEFQKQPEPFSLKGTFVQPFRMKSFIYVLMMYLMAFVAIDAVTSIVILYMRDFLDRGSIANFVLGALLVAQVISLPFYTWLSRRTSKRTSYMVGAGAWITVLLLSFLLSPEMPTWMIYAFGALIGLGSGGVVVMIYAIFPDIPDIDELRSGERREGIYSAMFTFMRKLSSALAAFMVGQALNAAGYLPPVEQIVDGAAQLIYQAQSAQFVLTLRIIFAAIPISFLAVALFFASRYPLTHDLHARLKAVLETRRAGQPADAEEVAALDRALF